MPVLSMWYCSSVVLVTGVISLLYVGVNEISVEYICARGSCGNFSRQYLLNTTKSLDFSFFFVS